MDYLQPLHDTGRPEYILIELDGYILPIAEVLLHEIRMCQVPEIQKVFSRYHDFDTIEDYDQFYREFAFHTESSFLRRLSEQELSDEAIQNASIVIHDTNDDASIMLHETVLSFGLHEILRSHFCKKVYLFNKRPIQNWEAKFIASSFDTRKIEVAHGNMLQFIEDHPELTTLMINSLDDTITILKNPDIYQLNCAMIFLRYSDDTLRLSNGKTEDNVAVTFNRSDEIMALTNKRGSKVEWLPIDCIPTNPLGEPVGEPLG